MVWLLILTTKTAVWAAENPSTNPSEIPATLQLVTDTAHSREGYFVLSWSSESDYSQLQLQQSSSAEFTKTANRNVAGIDQLTITGLIDGDYFYRLLAGGEIVSDVLRVRVEHHSLTRAFSFFFLGSLLFAVLLLSILRGHRTGGASDAG